MADSALKISPGCLNLGSLKRRLHTDSEDPADSAQNFADSAQNSTATDGDVTMDAETTAGESGYDTLAMAHSSQSSILQTEGPGFALESSVNDVEEPPAKIRRSSVLDDLVQKAQAIRAEARTDRTDPATTDRTDPQNPNNAFLESLAQKARAMREESASSSSSQPTKDAHTHNSSFMDSLAERARSLRDESFSNAALQNNSANEHHGLTPTQGSHLASPARAALTEAGDGSRDAAAVETNGGGDGPPASSLLASLARRARAMRDEEPEGELPPGEDLATRAEQGTGAKEPGTRAQESGSTVQQSDSNADDDQLAMQQLYCQNTKECNSHQAPCISGTSSKEPGDSGAQSGGASQNTDKALVSNSIAGEEMENRTEPTDTPPRAGTDSSSGHVSDNTGVVGDNTGADTDVPHGKDSNEDYQAVLSDINLICELEGQGQSEGHDDITTDVDFSSELRIVSVRGNVQEAVLDSGDGSVPARSLDISPEPTPSNQTLTDAVVSIVSSPDAEPESANQTPGNADEQPPAVAEDAVGGDASVDEAGKVTEAEADPVLPIIIDVVGADARGTGELRLRERRARGGGRHWRGMGGAAW